MASITACRRSYGSFNEHYDQEYYYSMSYTPQQLNTFRCPEDILLSQHPSGAMTALPDVGRFTAKQRTSDLYRIDSGFSLNHYDTASSTYSSYGDRHRSPSTFDQSAHTPDHITDFHHLEIDDPYMLGHQTIAMPEIQGIADAAPDHSAIDIDMSLYTSAMMPQEGYHPLSESTTDSPGSSHYTGVVIHSPEPRSMELPPVIRQRRPPARSNTVRQNNQSNRVSKRNAGRRTSSYASPTTASDNDDDNLLPRTFHCPLAPYGCESTFGSKNEWKRHFSTQHLRLDYWRCDQCSTSHGKRPNDFNRRDLFTQHVRRMHGQANSSARKRKGRLSKLDNLDVDVAAAAARCHRRLRSPPTSSICIICEQQFHGEGSWDERMEHLGKHFESAKRDANDNMYALDVESWSTDTEVERWMVTEGILTSDLELGSAVEESKD